MRHPPTIPINRIIGSERIRTTVADGTKMRRRKEADPSLRTDPIHLVTLVATTLMKPLRVACAAASAVSATSL